MKITRVEAIYLRQPDVRFLCDSGQDALICEFVAEEEIPSAYNPRIIRL